MSCRAQADNDREGWRAKAHSAILLHRYVDESCHHHHGIADALPLRVSVSTSKVCMRNLHARFDRRIRQRNEPERFSINENTLLLPLIYIRTSPQIDIEHATRLFDWFTSRQPLPIGYVADPGPASLLLPSLSTIPSRRWMRRTVAQRRSSRSAAAPRTRSFTAAGTWSSGVGGAGSYCVNTHVRWWSS